MFDIRNLVKVNTNKGTQGYVDRISAYSFRALIRCSIRNVGVSNVSPRCNIFWLARKILIRPYIFSEAILISLDTKVKYNCYKKKCFGVKCSIFNFFRCLSSSMKKKKKNWGSVVANTYTPEAKSNTTLT